VMGHTALNCMNDDTPHMFPSQQARIDHLETQVEELTRMNLAWATRDHRPEAADRIGHLEAEVARLTGELDRTNERWLDLRVMLEAERAVADQLAALFERAHEVAMVKVIWSRDEDTVFCNEFIRDVRLARAAYNALKETP
jgi:hypothetical protein